MKEFKRNRPRGTDCEFRPTRPRRGLPERPNGERVITEERNRVFLDLVD